MESLGLPDAVFAINRSNNQRGGAVGSGGVGRRRRNIRDNDDDYDNDDNDEDYYNGNNRGNRGSVGVGRVRTSSRNLPSVPTRQMPPLAAKSGEKLYDVPGEEDILEED